MKKLLIVTALIVTSVTANATTWVQNGTLMSNVCQSGPNLFYFGNVGYPVGSACWFKNPWGVHYGVIIAD